MAPHGRSRSRRGSTRDPGSEPGPRSSRRRDLTRHLGPVNRTECRRHLLHRERVVPNRSVPPVLAAHDGGVRPRGEHVQFAGVVPPDDIVGITARIHDLQHPAHTVTLPHPTPTDDNLITDLSKHGCSFRLPLCLTPWSTCNLPFARAKGPISTCLRESAREA